LSDDRLPSASENMLPSADDSPDRASLIRNQLEKILTGSGFIHSVRMCRFLRYVVECSLSGDADRLKESVIGVAVFNRPPSYDPKVDPIVRVEARRLRDKIHEYYEREGAADAVVISLPKGGYAPAFEIRTVETPQPVEVIPSLPAPAPVPVEQPSVAAPSRGLLWGMVAAAAVFAGAALFLWLGRKSAPIPSLVPLTSLPGNAFRPSISPDGKRVAFVWDGGSGNFDIYVKLINTGDPLRLTTNPAQDLDPAWSPDGRQIAFVRWSPDRHELFIIPSLGGAEQKVADLAPSQVRWQVDGNLYRRTLGPSWSPDGEQIAVAGALSRDEPESIYLIAVETGEKRRLTKPDRRDETDSEPAFSPRGNLLAFVRMRAGATGSPDLYVQPLAGGAPKRLTFDRRQISGLTWTPDGRRIVFASERDGEYRLWQVRVSGAPPTLVAGADRRARHPSMLPDGRRLAFTEMYYSTKIWRVSLGTGGATAPEPFLSSSRKDDSPQYSHDGRKVVFVSDRAGAEEIWICDADGANAAPLASLRGFIPGTPRWSPDGAEIVLDSRHEGFAAVYVTAAQGSGRPRRLTPETSNSMMPSWSHDGRSIYYSSDRSGSWQIWKQPAAGGPAWQITRNGGREAKESLDGSLYYDGNERVGIWKAPLDGGAPVPVPGLEAIHHYRHWTVVDRGIYYLSREEPPWTVSFYEFATRRITPVFTIPNKPVFGSPGLTVSPDGRSILYSQVDRQGSDVMLLENFE
jgi:Tol biopolymer transport system component